MRAACTPIWIAPHAARACSCRAILEGSVVRVPIPQQHDPNGGNSNVSMARAISAASAIVAIMLIGGCHLDVPAPIVGPAPQRVGERFISEPAGCRLES